MTEAASQSAPDALNSEATPSSCGVRYHILENDGRPFLLARVRWPDIAEAVSVGRPVWQSDPGLFDLPYDPSGLSITEAEADGIAADWGAPAASDMTLPGAPPIMRRMPPNWSELTPAERRQWRIESVTASTRPPRERHDLWIRMRVFLGWPPRLAGLTLAADAETISPQIEPARESANTGATERIDH